MLVRCGQRGHRPAGDTRPAVAPAACGGPTGSVCVQGRGHRCQGCELRPPWGWPGGVLGRPQARLRGTVPGATPRPADLSRAVGGNAAAPADSGACTRVRSFGTAFPPCVPRVALTPCSAASVAWRPASMCLALPGPAAPCCHILHFKSATSARPATAVPRVTHEGATPDLGRRLDGWTAGPAGSIHGVWSAGPASVPGRRAWHATCSRRPERPWGPRQTGRGATPCPAVTSVS